jgi:outer membrane protein
MKKWFVTGLLTAQVWALPVWAEDLMDVYQLALKSDPQLQAAAASRLATAELDKQALANFLPQVSLSADLSKTNTDSNSSFSGGQAHSTDKGYNLSLVQSLFDKQNFVEQAQADIALDGANAAYEEAKQALIVRVAERYFGVLGAQDDLTFAQAEREAIEKQLEQTQQRFEVGIDTITDVLESQAAFDLAVTNVIQAENTLANSQESLRETTGQYFEALSTLQAESPLIKPEPENVEEWTQTALASNPSLLVSRANVNTAKENINLQKSGHYPTLDLVAQKLYDESSETTTGGSRTVDTELLGLQFNLPIYSGGEVSSRSRQAGHQLNEAMQNEEAARRSVNRQTREAYNGVISGVSRVKALKQAVLSNEKALESSEAGYDVGTRTTVDVLNARRNLFSARRDHARARYEYILDTLRLKQAAGIADLDDIKQINTWLQSDS